MPDNLKPFGFQFCEDLRLLELNTPPEYNEKLGYSIIKQGESILPFVSLSKNLVLTVTVTETVEEPEDNQDEEIIRYLSTVTGTKGKDDPKDGDDRTVQFLMTVTVTRADSDTDEGDDFVSDDGFRW